MNPNERHQAAGAAETVARGEVKQEWFKRPFALNSIIAATITVIAILISLTFPLTPFWKTLIGLGLLWAGKKVTGVTMPAARFWGNILRGLGGIIILVTILQSGVRHVAEQSFNWIDTSLTEIATGNDTPAAAAKPSTSWFSQGAREDGVERIDLSIAQVGETKLMKVPVTTTFIVTARTSKLPQEPGLFRPCFKAATSELSFTVQFERIAGDANFTKVKHYKVKEEHIIRLIKAGVTTLPIVVQQDYGPKHQEICANHAH